MGLQRAIRIKLSDALAEHLEGRVEGDDAFASLEDYVVSLIEQDAARRSATFDRHKAALQTVFSTAEDDAVEMTADDFLAQMKSSAA